MCKLCTTDDDDFGWWNFCIRSASNSFMTWLQSVINCIRTVFLFSICVSMIVQITKSGQLRKNWWQPFSSSTFLCCCIIWLSFTVLHISEEREKREKKAKRWKDSEDNVLIEKKLSLLNVIRWNPKPNLNEERKENKKEHLESKAMTNENSSFASEYFFIWLFDIRRKKKKRSCRANVCHHSHAWKSCRSKKRKKMRQWKRKEWVIVQLKNYWERAGENVFFFFFFYSGRHSF